MLYKIRKNIIYIQNHFFPQKTIAYIKRKLCIDLLCNDFKRHRLKHFSRACHTDAARQKIQSRISTRI